MRHLLIPLFAQWNVFPGLEEKNTMNQAKGEDIWVRFKNDKHPTHENHLEGKHQLYHFTFFFKSLYDV